MPAFIVNFCLKTGPVARKGFPVFRVRCKTAARHFVRVIPLPVTGGPALSGLIEITRLAMMPGQTEKETSHVTEEHEEKRSR